MLAKISELYNKLQDDVSKEIFINRINYSVTGNKHYIEKIVDIMYMECCRYGYKPYSVMRGLVDNNDKIVICGAGSIGKLAKPVINKMGLKIESYCDSNGDILCDIDGIKVYSYEDGVKLFPNSTFLICVFNNKIREKIKEQLYSLGIMDDKIVEFSDILGVQYFDGGIDFPKSKGAFLDVGSFDGATVVRFKEWYKDDCSIYSFEPDVVSVNKVQKTLTENKIEANIMPYGAWNENTTLSFNISNAGTSRVSNEGSSVIEARMIDSIIDEKVGFIKMDVEGVEREALLGARKTITRDKPILAISVYHKSSDIIDLFSLIDDFSIDYKYYIRHYATSAAETILYAIPVL